MLQVIGQGQRSNVVFWFLGMVFWGEGGGGGGVGGGTGVTPDFCERQSRKPVSGQFPAP